MAKRKTSKKKTKRSTTEKPALKEKLERELEAGLKNTFPASDPVAVTDPTVGIKK